MEILAVLILMRHIRKSSRIEANLAQRIKIQNSIYNERTAEVVNYFNFLRNARTRTSRYRTFCFYLQLATIFGALRHYGDLHRPGSYDLVFR